MGYLKSFYLNISNESVLVFSSVSSANLAQAWLEMSRKKKKIVTPHCQTGFEKFTFDPYLLHVHILWDCANLELYVIVD